MWEGYEQALMVYINKCIYYWKKRGGNTKYEYFDVDEDNVKWPWWAKWRELHLSHRASLLRKKPDHYSDYFNLEDEKAIWLEYGYIWPSKMDKKIRKGVLAGKKYSPEEVCSDIGAGAPAEYRWTVKEVKKWKKDKTVNPKTGRTINPNAKSGVYQDIEKAYKYYKSVGKI